MSVCTEMAMGTPPHAIRPISSPYTTVKLWSAPWPP